MKLIIFDKAQGEIDELVAWYAQRNPEAAQRLAHFFDEIIRLIQARSERFPRMEMRRNPGNVCRARNQGFPAYIAYEVFIDRVHGFAVPHTASQPGYWKSRLGKKETKLS
jgi:plasmid stabilization system protein ParE